LLSQKVAPLSPAADESVMYQTTKEVKLEMYELDGLRDFLWQENHKSNNDIYFLENMDSWSNELRRVLDKALLNTLTNFSSSNETAILIRGCPIGNLPDTPVTSGYIESEHVMLSVSSVIA
jgi:hypothetical protein